MLIQEDDQEPVYTELKREKEDEKSKIKVIIHVNIPMQLNDGSVN